MLNSIKENIVEFLFNSNADACAVGIIDFENKSFETTQYQKKIDKILKNEEKIFFDLASLTKVFVNSFGFLINSKKFDNEDELVLNHRGSLPSWGLLSNNKWKEHIRSFEIRESDVLYSDFSALRFMLNAQDKHQIDLYKTASLLWDEDLKSWLDLKKMDITLQNGYVKQRPNFTMVHDPNAQNIKEKLSHAGLFGSIEGVCKSLLLADSKESLLKIMENSITDKSARFVNGWDRAQDLENTLAGKGCSGQTFGHLGFTGTSIWIDSAKRLGHVILTNSTKEYWYDKQGLNDLRRHVGQTLWSK